MAGGEAVRIGVIGCGAIAEAVHLPNLAGRADARVVAVADPVEAARERVGALVSGAKRYAEVGELLGDAEVDAVIIASPSAYHADAAVAAFEAGKHVYLEKPIATSLADGRRVVEAWRASGKVGMVGFNYRCRPDVGEARPLIEGGALGPITAVRSVFTRAAGQTDGWRTSGGARAVLLDFASHEIDLAAHLLGEAIEGRGVEAWSAAFEDDSAQLTARSASGVMVSCLVSYSAVDEARLEVIGQRGQVTIDRYGALSCDVRGSGAVGPIGRAVSALKGAARVDRLWARRKATWGEPAFAACLGRFVEGVREGRQATPSLEDGLASLRVIDEALAGGAAALRGGASAGSLVA